MKKRYLTLGLLSAILVASFFVVTSSRAQPLEYPEWPSFEITYRVEGYGLGAEGKYGAQSSRLNYINKFHWAFEAISTNSPIIGNGRVVTYSKSANTIISQEFNPQTGKVTETFHQSDRNQIPGEWGSPAYIERQLKQPGIEIRDIDKPNTLTVLGGDDLTYKTFTLTLPTPCNKDWEESLKGRGLTGLASCPASGLRNERIETTYVIFPNRTKLLISQTGYLDDLLTGLTAVESLTIR